MMTPYATAINYFMTGGNAMASLIISFFFWRYYQKVLDRFFLFFSLAFLIFAFERIVIVFGQVKSEYFVVVYSIRLLGFITILLAILEKNRKKP